MFESLILGAIQGTAEWLPISSEGLLLLAARTLGDITLSELLRLALFLHLGTTLAAIAYFWREIANLLRALFSYKSAPARERAFLRFLIISTLVSGMLALSLFIFVEASVGALKFGGKTLMATLAILLAFTGVMQLKKKERGTREIADFTAKDGILLGLAQGVAALPGISRSGITIAALLLRNVREESALVVSFIMSIPLVLAGNLILNFAFFSFSTQSLVGLSAAFFFGIITIHYLLALARKVNFGWFVIGFAALIFLSLFV